MIEILATRRDLLDMDGVAWIDRLPESERHRLRAVMAQPAVTLRLRVERPGVQGASDGWLSSAGVLLHPEGHADDALPTLLGPPGSLPSIVAREVGLGVRPRAPGGRAMLTRDELVSALVDAMPIDGFGPVTAVWTLEWRPRGANPDGMTVVDQGASAPLWRLAATADDGRMVLDEVSPLDVWLALGGLLGLLVEDR